MLNVLHFDLNEYCITITIYYYLCNEALLPSAQDPDPDPLDSQDFGFLDPRGKISTKTAIKRVLLLKPKSEPFKKREIIKMSSFLNGSSSFKIKVSKKMKEKI